MVATSANSLPPHRNGTESRFLKHQSADARNAMSQTMHDMHKTLLGVVNVRSWTTKHPWIVTGSVVAVGFIMGAALTTPRVRRPKSRSAYSKADLQARYLRQESARARKSILLSNMGGLLVGLLKFMARGLVAAAFVSREDLQTQGHDHSVSQDGSDI